MTHLRVHGTLVALVMVSGTLLLPGCVVPDGGRGYDTDVRIGVGYYDSGFGDYGGWGPGYRVGPPRQVWPLPDAHRDRPPHQGGYRPAPGAHPVPSIPSRPHPPGGRSSRPR